MHKQTKRRPALVRPVFRTLLLPRLQFAERKINTFITAGGPKAYDVKDMPTQSLVPVQVRVWSFLDPHLDMMPLVSSRDAGLLLSQRHTSYNTAPEERRMSRSGRAPPERGPGTGT